MDRDLKSLASRSFDLVVVGGGIYGAAITWEAASRGLSVALVEKGDFGGGTSSNSLKIIHGGLRYLQHLDLKRLRRSARERMNLMRIAPHLVHPLPTLVPTYGHGLRGREVMALALATYDLLTLDRNRLEDPEKHIPCSRIVPAAECRELLPGVDSQGLTGGAVYHDAQVYNSERLVLAFVKSAYEAGAVVANYVEVTGLLRHDGTVTGVTVQDSLAGDTFDVRGAMTVNAAGPWAWHVLGLMEGCPAPDQRLVKAFNVITRPLFDHFAVGMPSRRPHFDTDAVVNTGSRLFFVAPWRQRSIVGTDYVAHDGGPHDSAVAEREVAAFLDAFNEAMPGVNLSLGDLTFVHAGLLPMSGADTRTGSVQAAKRPTFYDHRNDGLDGLISVVGVKYTTARAIAEMVVDRLPRDVAPSRTAHLQLKGGDVERFGAYLEIEKQADRFNVGADVVGSLIANYGSEYPAVMRYLRADQPDDHDVVRAQVLYAVKEEMAMTLADVVLRRTDLGTAEHPGRRTLEFCATLMADLLDWNEARVREEKDRIDAAYPAWLPTL